MNQKFIKGSIKTKREMNSTKDCYVFPNLFSVFQNYQGYIVPMQNVFNRALDKAAFINDLTQVGGGV